MTENATGKPLQIYIFSHPRTISNLFCKLFSQHPSIIQEKYPFLFTYFFGPEAQHQIFSKEMDALYKTYGNIAKEMTYQASLDKIQNLFAETRRSGKFLMLKDHSYILTKSKEVQKVLGRPCNVAPEPKMVDKMLDLSESERADLTGSPYHNPDADVSNPTVLPDRMMQMFAPVFIIRHPIKQIESCYRASRMFAMRPDGPDFGLTASYRFTRKLFNYYAELYRPSGRGRVPNVSDESGWPIVIDGDDLVNNTEGITNRFCELTGINPEGVIYSWESEKVTTDPIGIYYLGTLKGSDGVKRNKELKIPDIAEASMKWSEDWGAEVGDVLVKHVEDAMPDYEYLHQYRLKNGSA